MISTANQHSRRRLSAAAVLLFATATLSSVFAQTVTSTIAGTVTDPSGAAIAGAKVAVKNVGTGVAENRVTDRQGRYRVDELIVGDYTVQASQTGFETVLHKGINLTVGSEATVDFSLPVGQSQQTVTVESQVSQVETSSTAISTLVEPQQMTDLPLNGRNFEQLMTLAPGVITVPTTGGGFYGKQDNYSVAGSRPLGQGLLIDNQNFVGFWGHATGSAATGSQLGVEAISQFQTLTNTYTAQFGGNGGVMNAASKSGSNGIHGSLYEFFRNSAMDSRSPFDTTIRPGNTTAHPPTYHRNQFGGSLGGPIKKDKLFYFVNYEGLRAPTGRSQLMPNLPDANAHQGYLPCGVANGTVTVPGAPPPPPPGPGGAPAPAPQTFACNNATGLAFVGLPASIAPIMALFPTGPTTQYGVGNLTQVVVSRSNEDYMLGRLDYTISDKDSIFVRAVRDHGTFATQSGGPGSVYDVPEVDITSNYFASIEERHIVSANLVNLARVSFSRPLEDETQSGPQLAALTFAPPQPNGRVSVGGNVAGISQNVPSYLRPAHYIVGDDIILTHGAHNIRAGVSMDRVDDNEFVPTNLGGTYTFNTVLTFLEAQPSSVTLPLPGHTNANRGLRTTFLAPYIQDEWKYSRNLTLNLGLRYEWSSNPNEVNNLLSNVTQFNSGYVTGNSFVPVPNVLQSNISKKNFAPRAGFAWSPFADHKTSIRGGFGIFYQLLTAKDLASSYWGTLPFLAGTGTNPTFPNPFLGAGAAAPLPGTNGGLYYGAGSTPLNTQYNLNVQRDLGRGMIFTLGYTGGLGRHLLQGRDFNTPQLLNGTWGTLASNGNTTPNPRADVNFSGMVLRNTVGNSNYNGLLATMNHRFSQHWQMQASYTYSKSLDNGSAGAMNEAGGGSAVIPSNPYNARIDYAPSNFNRKQAFRLSGTWETPWRNAIAGGWRLTGIYTRFTGQPLDIVDGFDRSGLGNGASPRPNLAPGYSNNPILGGPNQYFDPKAFQLQTPGTLGNLGRNTLTGPGLSNLDLALLRNVAVKKISEQFNVQFRAEIFNLPNHPNWGAPNTNVFQNGSGPNGTINPTAGQVTATVGNARQIQFGLRFGF